jgi:hypothetical protein
MKMSRRISKRMKELLPWYVNGTLSAADQNAVERGRDESPGLATELAAWQRLHAAVRAQPEQRVAPAVWEGVLAQVRSSCPTGRRMVARPRMAWAWGGLLALAVMLLLWGSIQPGIVLRWSVDNVALTAFRVYRAAPGSTDFELVQEVPAEADAQQYTYVDPLLVPGRTYVYRVEGVGPGSQSVFSQAVVASAIEALPGQLAILLIGLAGGYVTVSLMSRWRGSGNGRWGLRQLTI